jgi:hypothetical protein
MLRGFICPDGERIDRLECIEKCRIGRRCLTLPTLYELSQEREYNGHFSTTQLLNPFRISYLRIKSDYWIKPEDRAFQILGVRHHAVLEKSAKLHDLMCELKLKGDTEITGILDILEPHESIPDAWVMTDYKSWGSAALIRFDNKHDVVYQLNHYRLLANKVLAPGYVERLQVQITVRDGGTKAAYANGIKERIKILDVPMMADAYIAKFFNDRAVALGGYIDRGELPPMCDDTWNGRRCQGFCETYESCPEGRKIHNLPVIPVSLKGKYEVER